MRETVGYVQGGSENCWGGFIGVNRRGRERGGETGRERRDGGGKAEGGTDEAVFIGLGLLWACSRPKPLVTSLTEAAATESVYCSKDSTHPLFVLLDVVDMRKKGQLIALE